MTPHSTPGSICIALGYVHAVTTETEAKQAKPIIYLSFFCLPDKPQRISYRRRSQHAV